MRQLGTRRIVAPFPHVNRTNPSVNRPGGGTKVKLATVVPFAPVLTREDMPTTLVPQSKEQLRRYNPYG